MNLRGIGMIWWHFGLLCEALERHFDSDFTWYPYDLVAFWVAWRGSGTQHAHSTQHVAHKTQRYDCTCTWPS